jgi:Domain of unknown function (DUF1707)
MGKPQDQMPADAGRGHLRTSHADREHAIEVLKAAFVAGMLAKDEFDLRVSQAFASRTYAELATLTADLPAGLAAARLPKPARAKDGQPVLRPGQIITGATLLYAVLWVYALFFPHDGDDGSVKASLVLVGGLAYLGVVAIAVAVAAENRRDKRSGGQPPQRPALGTGGQASRRPPSADPGRQLPPGGPGQQQSAEAAPIRRPLLPGWRPQATTGYLTHPA